MADTKFLNFSKPFIDATKTVFETMVFTKIETKKPEVKGSEQTIADVSAILGINGKYNNEDVKGMLILSWPMATYLNIASAMLGEQHQSFNNEISDVGAEIVNMIFGNAKRVLNEVGYNLNMAIPTTIGGKNHYLNYPQGTTTILIPIISAHGDFYMEICYNI